ncbi:Ig-like domain-containing protein [Epilithonimonas caeni]|uniref:Ig-like domain-containing protein n=1 Tax=Epilithonimonas caeni TaxID=365343 RepID=UPI000407CFF5|nr:Ig-like domain-containing protein [Epilithonimonas caeni]
MKRQLFIFSCLLFLLMNNVRAQVWESVGSSAGISQGNAGRLTLINDFQDNLYVGYYDVPALKGSVQKFDGTSWSYVGSQGITTTTAGYNSLSVNNQGVPYFLNQAVGAETGHQVRAFQNGTWTSLPNVTNSIINFNSSIISSDNVLFAVNNEGNGTVKKFVNGSWVQVGNTGFAGGVPNFVDIVTTTNGKVYVSFNTSGNVRVYVNDQNASSTDVWQPAGGVTDLAPSPTSEDYSSSLAVDQNNNIYVAYQSNSAGGNKLNVKKFDGTSWSQVGPVNFSPGRTKHSSIAIGANNKVYVAVSNWEDANLLRNYVMGYNSSTDSWSQVGTGYASQGQGIYNSLAVNSTGDLFLAYVDSQLAKLCVKKLNLEEVAPTSLEITTQNNVAPNITTDKGTLQLNSTILPANASQDVIWSVESGSTFATVSPTGLVSAIASNAVVTIKAASALNFAVFDTIDVTITNQNSTVEQTGIELTTLNNEPTEIFGIGNTLQLKATILPAEADQYVNWTIQEGSNVVSVDANGKVTSLANGYAIIRATSTKSSIYDEIRIDVFANGCKQGNEGPSSVGFRISDGGIRGTDDFFIPVGTRFEMSKLRLRILTSSTSPVSKVDIHFLQSKQNGQPGAAITEVYNLTPTSQRFIKDDGFGSSEYEIEINFPSITFNEGTYWLNPVVNVEDGSVVYWNSTIEPGLGSSYFQDMSDGNGWVVVAGGGFAGSYTLVGNCTPMPLTVAPVQGQDANIFIGETVQLQAKLNGTDTSNVNWTLDSGSNYASVNSNGLVTGLASGIAKVRVTEPNTGNYAVANIYVTDPNACGQEVPSNNQEEGWTFSRPAAIDIDVPVGTRFNITSVLPTTVGFGTTFTFKFYKDNNESPGEEILTTGGQIVEDTTGPKWDGIPYYVHKYEVKLNQEVKLEAGKYWMSMDSDAAGWESTTAQFLGNPMMLYDNGAWIEAPTGSDFVYELKGTCVASDLATNEVSGKNLKFYPNPVKDVLNFDASQKVESIEIYGMAGQKLNHIKLSAKNGVVSTEKLPTGVYIFKAYLEDETTQSFRVVKK